MRDFVIIVGFLGYLPLILFHPHIGVLIWAWFSIMNPHREAYGFALHQNYNVVIIAVTLIAWLFSRERKLPVMGTTTVLLFFFGAFMALSASQAIVYEKAWEYFNFIPSKVLIFIFVVLVLINTPQRIHAMVWIMCLSIGYFAVRNGLNNLAAGGRATNLTYYGPVGSMLQDRNHLSLAMVMTLPLLYYLYRHTAVQWVRRGVVVVALLTLVAIVGSYSRGAMLGLGAVAVFLWTKTPRKLYTLAGLAALALPVLLLMPDSWKARMDIVNTISTDASFQLRVLAWETSWRVANDRPIVGGGFHATQQEEVIARYGVAEEIPRAAHSIYFQILGDLGFMGFGIFIAIAVVGWRNTAWIRRRTRGRLDLMWAYDLATMIQVAMVGYLVGGAALSLAYYDGYYLLIALAALAREIVARKLGEEAAQVDTRWRGRGARRPAQTPAE